MKDVLTIIAIIFGTVSLVLVIVMSILFALPIVLNLWEWWQDITDDFFDKLRWKE